MAPCADFSWREETADSNSALGPAVGALQGGGGISEEGGGGEETVQARKAREAMMVKSRGRGPKVRRRPGRKPVRALKEHVLYGSSRVPQSRVIHAYGVKFCIVTLCWTRMVHGQ